MLSNPVSDSFTREEARSVLGSRPFLRFVAFAAPLLAASAQGVPVIESTTPLDQAIGASRSVSVRIRFATPMDTTTILPSNLLATSSMRGTIAGSLSWSTPLNELTFDPFDNFLVGERVGLSLSKNFEDAQGEPLANGYHFEFSTWSAPMPEGQYLASAESWPIGSVALNLTVADLDGDDLPEVILSNVVPDSLTVLSPDGAGGFVPYASLATGILPRHVVAADLDGNGWPDLVTCASGPNLVQVFFNDGTPPFPPPVDFPTGATPYGAYAGDLDADGDLDVATANFNGHTVSILRNLGGGVLAPSVNYGAGVGANSPRWVDGADFDRDGDIDLACCNGGSDDCSIFLNSGDGIFVPQSVRYPVGDNPNFMEARDLNQDGIVDLVTVNAQDGTVSFLGGNGDGTFRPRVTSPVGGSLPYGLQVADMDGDHDLDLVVPIRGVNAWRVMVNGGAGVFSQGPLHFGGTHCHTVGVADWDLDGDLDVVSGFAISKTLHYYEQALAPGVLSTQPSPNSIGVPIDGSVSISFNTNLASPTVDPAAFHIVGSQSGPHASTLVWDDVERRATLTPQTPYFSGELVTVTATSALAAQEGIPFAGYTFEFMTQSAVAAGHFSSSPFTLPGSDPIQVEACDFDQDGDSDLAVVNYASNDATVIRFGPGGAPSSVASWPTGEGPVDLWPGDLDGDSRPDLAVANALDSSVTVLRSQGGGEFAASAPHPLAGSPLGIAGGDFDRDGDDDLVVSTAEPDGMRVLWNDGHGLFPSTSFLPTSGTPLDVAVADFDNDGMLDLAVAEVANDALRLFTFTPSIGFTLFGIFATGENPVSLFPWDTNGDGWIDLVTADFDGNGVTILENLAGEGFAAAEWLSTPDQPRAIAGADFNGDAVLDLATANSASSTLSVFLNEGGGVYGLPALVSVESTPYSVVCGDWNGDGAIDLVSLNRAAQALSILLNQEATGVPSGPSLAQEAGIRSILPNPFRASTQVRFELVRPGAARLRVFDLQGRVVAELVDGVRGAGSHVATWTGRNVGGEAVASGVYFLRLEAGGKSMNQKVFRVR